MSKVFTTNVFLTSSRKVIDKIFSSQMLSTDFNSLAKNLSRSESEVSVICSPNKNNNLISMSYEFGTEGGNNGVLTLTFLESNSLFEKIYLLSQTEDYQLSLNVSGQGQDPARDVPSVYVTFGVGNDLNDWAGPFSLRLKSANYEIDSSGNRIITLTYVPILGPIMRNIVQKRYNRYDYDKIDTGSQETLKYAITKAATISTKYIKNPEKLNKIYRSLLTSYFKAITNDAEIILLLPDISDAIKRYEPLIKQKKFKEFFSAIGLDSEPVRNPISKFILAIPEIMHDVKKIDLKIFDKYILRITNSKGLLPKNPNENDQTMYDPYLPVYEIGEKLKNLFTEDPAKTNTKGFQFRFCIENNIKLIKLFYKHKFITTDKKNVFIWGDTRLIDQLIYMRDTIFYSDLDTPPDLNGIKLTTEDQLKFINYNFRKDFFDAFLKQNFLKSSSFNEDVGIGVNIEEQDDDFLRKGGVIPVFRHGIINPNVIALNMEKSADLITFYNGQGFKGESRVAYVNNKNNIDSAKELSSDISKLNFSQITQRLEKLYKGDKDTFDKLGLTSDATSKISEYLKDARPDAFTDFDLSDFSYPPAVRAGVESDPFASADVKKLLSRTQTSEATAKASLVKLQNGLNDNINSYITVKSAQQAELVEKESFDRLKESVILIGIKTLPFFSILQLDRLCYLVAGDNNLIGTKKLNYASFLNGRYMIRSFKHFISRGESYSEFTIIPDRKQATVASYRDPEDPTKVITSTQLVAISKNNIPNNPKKTN